MNSKISARVTFLVLIGLLFINSAHAQQYYAKRGSVIQRGAIGIQTEDFRWAEGRITLLWEMNPGKEAWKMPIRFNSSYQVYYVERQSREGTDAFGRTEACITELRDDRALLELSPGVNLAGSYFIKQTGPNHFKVEAYDETREIEYLFATLDDLLNLRIRPMLAKEEPKPLGYSDSTAAMRLMFPMRDFMKSKKIKYSSKL